MIVDLPHPDYPTRAVVLPASNTKKICCLRNQMLLMMKLSKHLKQQMLGISLKRKWRISLILLLEEQQDRYQEVKNKELPLQEHS
jgi:hypothetical protein